MHRILLASALISITVCPVVHAGQPAPAKAPPVTKGQTMDYGPFLFYTVDRPSEDKDAKEPIHTNKGLMIKVAPDACILYDTELLRVSSAWTGGTLDLSKTNIGQLKGDFPAKLVGTVAFTTPEKMGWSVAKEFTDPRPKPHGPLPRESGFFRGLYVHGDKVILAYNIAGVDILEMPGFEDGAFTRTFHIAANKQHLNLLACSPKRPVALLMPSLTKLQDKTGAIKTNDFSGFEFQANSGALLAKIVYKDVPSSINTPVLDLSTLISGGPPRFAQTITTVGEEGKSDGPFAVDTLTLPDDNAWGAWMRPTALDMLPDGRLAVSTMNGDVWIVSGVGETLQSLTWKRYASGLFEPLGLRVVDGKIYVTCRDRIVRLVDVNNDGEADFYENFNSDSHTFDSYHDFTFDLQTDSVGNFYYVKGGNQVGWDLDDHSVVVKVSKDGAKREYIARGFRAPNGMGMGPKGELTVSDNQGHWTPASKINWIKPGGFYGFRGDPRRKNPNHATQTPDKMDPPLCWIPHAMDNSSAGQVWVPPNTWGPLAGHMLHLSYGKGTLHYVMTQDSGGVMQGATIKLPLAFASGIQRARFSPKDGHLYLCGLKGWQTSGNKDGAVHRVRYTGKPLYQPIDFAATPDTLTISFSQPLDPKSVDVDAFTVEQWQYKWQSEYGSKDYSIEDPTKSARDPVTIKTAQLSPDGKTVTLNIPGLKPVMQMSVKAKLQAKDGTPLPVEIYNTINKL